MNQLYVQFRKYKVIKKYCSVGFGTLGMGSTYIINSELLPAGYPITTAMIRAFPVGLLLLLIVRQLPRGIWIARVFILRLLSFTLFWILLFVSAYRLPGGMAATIGVTQPLIVVFIAVPLLGRKLKAHSVIKARM